VTFESGREIPLGAADVEIIAPLKMRLSQPADRNILSLGQIEDGYIDSGV